MNLTMILLLVVVLAYFAVVVITLNSWDTKKKLELMADADRVSEMKVFFFERKFLDRFHLDPEKLRIALYIERGLLIAIVVGIFLALHGMVIIFAGAIFTIIWFEDAYQRVIYDSGITNIPNVNNFINYFVPHINAGNSADQSLLGYIDYSGDENLSSFYENRGNPDYKLSPHLRQIVDIYDIAKYNEEKGISDYTYILNELSQDYAQKQVYYNNFIARIGEIKPIVLSYYFAVPILIFISFGQTRDFWLGTGGAITSVVILILFVIFKFLIYKLQKDTIKAIF